MKTASTNLHRFLQALALCSLLASARAQDHPMDLRELSLKELMSLDMVEIAAGDPTTVFGGSWAVGYRYLFQQMRGYQVGRDRVEPASLLRTRGGPFLIVQDEMTQEVHIIELTYAPTDRLTFLAGIPFISQTTAHERVTDRVFPNPDVAPHFDITTSGLSDVSVKAAYKLFERPTYQFIAFGGVSLPTGSINETGDVPTARNFTLPYTMQLGSGTFDLDPGLAYSAKSENWSWGAEFMYKLRLGRNSAGYNFGNRCAASVYLTRRVSDWFAPSVILTGRGWEEISGRDRRLDRVIPAVPVANPRLYGGDRLDLLFRLNFAIPEGILKGNRLAVEGGLPVYQKLNGPQMRADWRLSASWQWAF